MAVGMWRYEQHCRSDSYDLIEFLMEHLDDMGSNISAVYEKFHSMPDHALPELEEKHEDVIGDLIKRSNYHRPALLRRIEKEHGASDVAWVLLLAVCSLERVAKVMDLCDDYGCYLIPGGGYRITAKNVFEFSSQVTAIWDRAFEWPIEIFMNMEIEYDEEDDEGWD